MTTAWTLVKRYALAFDQKGNHSKITIYFDDQEQEVSKAIFPEEHLSGYIADILRNDDPVWWEKDTCILSTGLERDLHVEIGWDIQGFDATTSSRDAALATIFWQTNEVPNDGVHDLVRVPTKGTILIGQSPEDLTEQEIVVEEYFGIHVIHVSGLTPDTEYFFKVCAEDEAGNRVNSSIISKRTKIPRD